MAYKIEISLKLKNAHNISGLTDFVVNKAYDCECLEHYVNYEYIHKKKAVIRNNCIINLTFDNNTIDIMKFIRFIKKNKKFYIENVGFEDTDYELLYASKQYLNIMEKGEAKYYIKRRKSGLLNENEIFRLITA